MSASAQVMNELFLQKLGTAEGKEKIAEYGTDYVKDHLREVSFADKIQPPKRRTKGDPDIQRSVNHDTFVALVEIEPDSTAMVVNFRGLGTARYVSGLRAEVPFIRISSPKWEKDEDELATYTMPIMKILEDFAVKDLHETKDRVWLTHVEAALQELQYRANANTVTSLSGLALQNGEVIESNIIKGELARVATADNWAVRPVQRPDFVNLFKILSGGGNGAGRGRLRMDVVLISEPDAEDMNQWTIEDLGDKLQSETMVDGYKYNQALGRRFVKTVKVDVVRPGNIYGFAGPEYLGRSYLLNDVKFYIDKVGSTVSMQCWMSCAVAIINVAACAKVELFSGSVAIRNGVSKSGFRTGNNTVADTAVNGLTSSAKKISSEESLGAVNNLISENVHFPNVMQY